MSGQCYQCKYRGTLPGSCHSKCLHSIAKLILADETTFLMALWAKKGSPEPLKAFAALANLAGVKLNDHGVAKAWAIWPVNFDPVWVESCKLYEEKQAEKK